MWYGGYIWSVFVCDGVFFCIFSFWCESISCFDACDGFFLFFGCVFLFGWREWIKVFHLAHTESYQRSDQELWLWHSHIKSCKITEQVFNRNICLWQLTKKKHRESIFLFLFYSPSWFSWSVRHISFIVKLSNDSVLTHIYRQKNISNSNRRYSVLVGKYFVKMTLNYCAICSCQYLYFVSVLFHYCICYESFKNTK